MIVLGMFNRTTSGWITLTAGIAGKTIIEPDYFNLNPQVSMIRNTHLLLIFASFAAASVTQAGVLAGWHTFPNGGPEVPLTSVAPNYVNATVDVTLNMGGDVISFYSTIGGGRGALGWNKYTSGGTTAFDMTYGTVPFPDAPELTKSGVQLGINENKWRFLDISIVNNGTSDLQLDGVHFDYALVAVKSGSAPADFEIMFTHVVGPAETPAEQSNLDHSSSVPIWRDSSDVLVDVDGTGWHQIDVDLSANLGTSDLGYEQLQLADRVLGPGERANFRFQIAGAGTTARVEGDWATFFALDNIAFTVNTITDPEPTPMWAGYAVDESGNVDTGAWLGVVHVDAAPWIWSFSLDAWLYLPEDVIDESGSWSFVAN